MNSFINRFQLAYSAIRQLGPKTIWYYAVYLAGLKTGYFRLRTPVARKPIRDVETESIKNSNPQPNFFLSSPGREQLREILSAESADRVVDEANEILNGQVRLFGGSPAPLCLKPTSATQHWSLYKESPAEDLKFIWEPVRFTWVFTLGRAYLLNGDERYPEAFYLLLDSFLEDNPTNAGPNWISGQEIALRILAFVFAWQVFSNSPASTPSRISQLYTAIQTHARRIPATLCYARSQNNNHLLSEAAGLFTAGVCLCKNSESAHWRKLGWNWFNWAIQNQIAPDGTYTQHSTNYHRLMLQIALWMEAAAKQQGVKFPQQTQELLMAATNWMMGQFDPTSGRVSNLGHNDGAYILPLASDNFSDYRAVIQAATSIFLEEPCLPGGEWDEMRLWFGSSNRQKRNEASQSKPAESNLELQTHLLGKNQSRLGNANNWSTLRSAVFNGRPAHADQLHVELWWHGYNLAMDAGTYRYTAPEPWQNALMGTAIHNSIQIDGQEQMLRAGRFLWLDWAQSRQLPEIENDYTRAAEHDGYRQLGIKHQRTLMWVEGKDWLIRDRLVPYQTNTGIHKAVIHWLIPDWPWSVKENDALLMLQLQTPDHQEVNIEIGLEENPQFHQAQVNTTRLIRAGEVIYGPPHPGATMGWFSPTYSVKLPALSLQLEFEGKLPFTIVTYWNLPSSE